MKRRSSLIVIAGVASTLVAGLGTLVAGFLGNALRRETGDTWVSIGPAEDLSSEHYKRYVLTAELRQAWKVVQVPLVIYVKDFYPKDPIAIHSTCTHLGCAVSHDAEKRQFRCPCHGGVYDEQGKVVSGPPPRPLTRLDIKIEGDVCLVKLPRPELLA